MYSIGYLIYGLDASFSKYGQSECAGEVLKALVAAIKEDPAAFQLNTDEAHAIGIYDEENGPDLGEPRDILTESFNCWSTYSGSGDGSPVAIGIELGSFDVCKNVLLGDITREAKITMQAMTEYEQFVIDTFPEAFALMLATISAQVWVIWGTS